MKLSDVMNRAKKALSEVADDLDTAITAVKEKHGNEISEVADTMIKGAANLVDEAIDAVEEAVSELKEDILKDTEAEETAAPEESSEIEAVEENAEAEAAKENAEIAAVEENAEAEAAAENSEPDTGRGIPDGVNKTMNKAQQNLDQIIAKLKKLVAEGNVDRIVVKKDGETVLNIPVNVGIVGGLIGLHSAPWIVAITALAAYGFKYQFEIVKKDGSTDEVE